LKIQYINAILGPCDSEIITRASQGIYIFPETPAGNSIRFECKYGTTVGHSIMLKRDCVVTENGTSRWKAITEMEWLLCKYGILGLTFF